MKAVWATMWAFTVVKILHQTIHPTTLMQSYQVAFTNIPHLVVTSTNVEPCLVVWHNRTTMLNGSTSTNVQTYWFDIHKHTTTLVCHIHTEPQSVVWIYNQNHMKWLDTYNHTKWRHQQPHLVVLLLRYNTCVTILQVQPHIIQPLSTWLGNCLLSL